MESFFFNITDMRYKVTFLEKADQGYLKRVDISNGIVFLEGKHSEGVLETGLSDPDRMVMIAMVKRGVLKIDDHTAQKESIVKEGETVIFVSSKQNMQLRFYATEHGDMFVLFIADFFLKRYLSGDLGEPIDLLYGMLKEEISLQEVSRLPVDALSIYVIDKLLNIQRDDRMQSIRAEHRVVEFMIHRFGLLDILPEGISSEEKRLALEAKKILLAEFIDPPTIEVLAHRCATNASKLKKVFKKVYGTTLYHYVQKLRLEEANMLLRQETLSIGEIAKRVGYRHQGHFSKLFYAAYGVYPKALRHS